MKINKKMFVGKHILILGDCAVYSQYGNVFSKVSDIEVSLNILDNATFKARIILFSISLPFLIFLYLVYHSKMLPLVKTVKPPVS